MIELRIQLVDPIKVRDFYVVTLNFYFKNKASRTEYVLSLSNQRGQNLAKSMKYYNRDQTRCETLNKGE